MNLKGVYADNINGWKKLYNREWKTEKALSVQTVENGYILPMFDMKSKGNYRGGVTDAEFNFVAGLLRNTPDNRENPGHAGCARSYVPEKEDIQYIEDECVFGGVICHHFGHFILESMGRLWYYLKLMDKVDQVRLPYICITVIGEKRKWFDEFFTLLDIPKDKILYADRPLCFSRIIIPEESVHSWHSFHPDYMIPYRRILSKIQPSPYKKIYLTRTDFHTAGTRCVNEGYFDRFFEKRGFKVISPEKYTIKEQIAFISGAEVIAATLGTLSHFAVFAKPGTKVVSLLRSSRETLPAQCVVAEAAECCQYIVDVASNFLYEDRSQGVSIIGPTDHWKRFVRDFFGEECRDSIDSNTYMDYFREWLQYYGTPGKYHWIRDIDNFDMLQQCSKILLGKELDRSKFNVGKTKKELKKEMDNNLQTMEDRNIAFLKRMCQGKDVMTSGILYYKVHGAGYGWTDICYENEAAGRQCSGRRLEAFKLDSVDDRVRFVYSAYIDGSGWSENASDWEVAGSVGRSLPIRSVRIAMADNDVLKASVRYRASLNGQWSEYAYDGETLNTFEWEFMEALQIELVSQ